MVFNYNFGTLISIVNFVSLIYALISPFIFSIISFAIEKCFGHYSPLIVERDAENVVHIFNSDSVYVGGSPFSQMIVGAVSSLSFQKEVYVVPEKRQHDAVSCPLFFIDDVTEIAKIVSRGGSLAEQLQVNLLVHASPSSQPHRLSLEQLPVGMLKMTQSVKKVHDLAHHVPSLIVRRQGKEERLSLEAYVDERSYYSFDERDKKHKKRNGASSYKMSKYMALFLGRAVQGELT